MIMYTLPKFLTRAYLSTIKYNHILTYSLNNTIRYGFAKQFDRQDLVAKLEKDIAQYNKQPNNIKERQQYFQEAQWKYEYLPEVRNYLYSKKTREYECKVLVEVYDHSEGDEPQLGQAPKEGQYRKRKYSAANIWMRKIGSTKWMVAQMGISGKEVVLATLSFREGEPRLAWDYWNTYPGPDINLLPDQVTGPMDHLFKQMGLSTEIVHNMVIHASSHCQIIDNQWVINLKEFIE